MTYQSDHFGPCPWCGVEKVLRARRRGIKERLIKLFSPHIRFYRCRTCGSRYMVNPGTPTSPMRVRRVKEAD